MVKKNKIILSIKETEFELIDEGCREWVSIIQRKQDMINERTKKQTREIAELKRIIKGLKD
jgi:hypothetical protein